VSVHQIHNAVWDSRLQCHFIGWQAIAPGELALYLPLHNVCDMTGAIKVAMDIMPSVWRIVTFQDKKQDTEYRNVSGKWAALG